VKERFRKVFEQGALIKIISESLKNPYKILYLQALKIELRSSICKERRNLKWPFFAESEKATLVAKKFFD